ncbi:MAG: type IV pilus secretin PilQ, partial [Thermodesulfobacteriota bacterium]
VEVIAAESEDAAAEAVSTVAEENGLDESLNSGIDEAISDENGAVEVIAAESESVMESASSVVPETGTLDSDVSEVMADTDTEIADALRVEKEAEAEADSAVQEDSAVVVTDAGAEAVTPVMEVMEETPTAPPISAGNNIKNIDYKKIGTKGFLTIETTAKPVYSIKKSNSGRTLVVDITDTLIGENLVRTLDATKLGTPVASISSYQGSTDPAVTRILIDLTAAASHSVVELDGTLSLVFEPVTKPIRVQSDGNAATPDGPRYTGKKIDLDMMDARITDILRLLAEVSNFNIIASDDVTGTISLRLRDVPWDQAFDIILKAKGLDKVKVGNVIRVAPATRISQERDAALAAVKASEKLEPLSIEFVAINYGKAKELEAHVKNVLSDRGSVTSETRTNTLIIKDIKKGIAAAEKLVSQLDTAIPQVLIEARIVEASSSFSRDLGVQWGVDYQTGGNVNANIFGSDATTGQTPPSGTNPAFETRNGAQNFAVNLPATGSIGTLGALGFILGKAGQNPLVLDLRLSAGEQEGQLRTISRPRIVTMDNKEAKIEDGESVPFETTSASGTSTIFIDANLSLTVTPHITPDGSVLMKIKASKNSIGTFTTSSGEPSIVKKEASTEVLVNDGETTVIGGIISSDSNNTNSGIPYLKDIPLMGKLFRSKSTKESQKELLIFITPSIMRGRTAG